MTTFQVLSSIEAADEAAAVAILQTWTLSAGAHLLSVERMPEYVEGLPLEIGESGSVADAIDDASEAADKPAVPPEFPDTEPPELPA